MDAAISAGADAVGLVFYPPSPRFVSLDKALLLAGRVPPFVSRVGLFVNAEADEVRRTCEAIPLELLQFHGDEDEDYCRQFGRPYIKVARMKPDTDLLEFALEFKSARALLLDAHVEGFGGAGVTFDWGLIPSSLPLPLILSGGLNAGNVSAGIRQVMPWAVDVSSSVESAKGIKDETRIKAFVAAVNEADEWRGANANTVE